MTKKFKYDDNYATIVTWVFNTIYLGIQFSQQTEKLYYK